MGFACLHGIKGPGDAFDDIPQGMVSLRPFEILADTEPSKPRSNGQHV